MIGFPEDVSTIGSATQEAVNAITYASASNRMWTASLMSATDPKKSPPASSEANLGVDAGDQR